MAQREPILEGLQDLGAAFQRMAQDQMAEAKRELSTFQAKTQRLNALAQLTQQIGLFAGTPEFEEEKLKAATGGVLSVKKGKGTKLTEQEAKTAREQMKIDAFRQLQNIKHEQKLTLEQAQHVNKLAEIAEQFKLGKEKEGARLMMDYLKTFGIAGDPAEVEAAERFKERAQEGEPIVPERPLTEEVAETPGKFLGLGKKKVTFAEVINLLGTEDQANAALRDYEAVRSVKEDKEKWQEEFFKEYPQLKNKIGF